MSRKLTTQHESKSLCPKAVRIYETKSFENNFSLVVFQPAYESLPMSSIDEFSRHNSVKSANYASPFHPQRAGDFPSHLIFHHYEAQ